MMDSNPFAFQQSNLLWASAPLSCYQNTLALQTFVILTKERTTVWVKQNVNFCQQNGSVIKMEQN
jgi:hypothetical protein